MGMEFNKSECITYVTRFSYYEYHNLCSGAVKTISWGFGEWVAAALLSLIALCALGFFTLAFGWDWRIRQAIRKGKRP